MGLLGNLNVHSFTTISIFITDPLKLIVTLKGEANKAQSSKAGIYILGPKPVNGKSHWLQDSGTNSIWLYINDINKGYWHIGPQDDLGTDIAGIVSYENVASPLKASTWHYSNNGRTKSDDISVDTFVEPGKVPTII